MVRASRVSHSPRFIPQQDANDERQLHLHAIARYSGLYRFDHSIWPGRDRSDVASGVKQNFFCGEKRRKNGFESTGGRGGRPVSVIAKTTLGRGFWARADWLVAAFGRTFSAANPAVTASSHPFRVRIGDNDCRGSLVPGKDPERFPFVLVGALP
jgi:hypothetical protein